MSPHDGDGMANSVDPDQTAPLGAVWSGSALFAQAYLSENYGIIVNCILQFYWIKVVFAKDHKNDAFWWKDCNLLYLSKPSAWFTDGGCITRSLPAALK